MVKFQIRSMSNGKEELINRIVEEKGVEAAPVLLSLLVSEDSETAQNMF